jgi:hypothetical protein
MIELNYLAIVVAAVAAFVVSSVYYIVLGKQLVELGSGAAGQKRPPAWKVPVELVRSLVVATVLAGLAAKLGIEDWSGAVQLALATWIGFAAVLYSGSVLWENVPWKLAAIHAGDWLVKTIVIAVIVSLWH